MRMKAFKLGDLLDVVLNGVTPKLSIVKENIEVNVTGLVLGEKLHEDLINDAESTRLYKLDDMYVVQPAEAFWFGHEWGSIGKRLRDDFRYVSNRNDDWLTVEQIQEIIKPIEEVFK